MSNNGSEWVFQWGDSKHGSDDTAQKYGEEIINLMDKNEGSVTKYGVLESAQVTTSPLHDYFEWDNGTAAEQYRLIQAGELLRFIHIIFSDEIQEPIRAFTSILQEDKRESLYVTIQTAMTDDDMRAQVLDRLRKHAMSWAKRARQYEEFAGVVAQIDLLVEEMELVPA